MATSPSTETASFAGKGWRSFPCHYRRTGSSPLEVVDLLHGPRLSAGLSVCLTALHYPRHSKVLTDFTRATVSTLLAFRTVMLPRGSKQGAPACLLRSSRGGLQRYTRVSAQVHRSRLNGMAAAEEGEALSGTGSNHPKARQGQSEKFVTKICRLIRFERNSACPKAPSKSRTAARSHGPSSS